MLDSYADTAKFGIYDGRGRHGRQCLYQEIGFVQSV
jgi:hypothetical protein